ncbi:Palmitoyltransferase [Favolaschia claudopus]|uniref:Palmitoyltransferase n=1 Tax=Favolaschia claudopus TaxID=2862362 RepID=A0AAW0ABQ3_9AGAR
MICSRLVFKCFKSLERAADRITGAAGPFFVTFAVVLIGTGTVCFFDVIMPSLSLPLLTFPVCVLIALNLWMHYFYVITVSPGFADEPPTTEGRSAFWARRRKGVAWAEAGTTVTRAAVTKCRKCGGQKPERTHHCRICKRCVLKYDHHWINQCVGLHNERHFVLFMAYLVLACLSFCLAGFPHVWHALGAGATFETPWPHHTPQIAFIMTYILAAVMALAVGIMCAFHLWGVAHGETTVEGQDHEVYRKMAKSRGETFVNSYDLGKRRNLQLFFNVGENGYPLHTLLLPLRLNPYTDGRSWARREGYERHRGVRVGEELTDEDEEDDAEAREEEPGEWRGEWGEEEEGGVEWRRK